jgi:signal peptidase I
MKSLYQRYKSWRSTPQKRKSFRQQALGLAWLVGAVLLIRSFVAEAYVVSSGSMIPTLEVGDRLMANKFVYGLKVPGVEYKIVNGRQVRRGEIILFVHPKEPDKTLIKRVIAVGGDTVEMRANQLFINGQAVKRTKLPLGCDRALEPKVQTPCAAFREELGGQCYRVIQRADGSSGDFTSLKIPEGHVFVMGDNRDNSDDSRFWGTVPYSHIKGKSWGIFWSSGDEGIRWGRFFKATHPACDSR